MFDSADLLVPEIDKAQIKETKKESKDETLMKMTSFSDLISWQTTEGFWVLQQIDSLFMFLKNTS